MIQNNKQDTIAFFSQSKDKATLSVCAFYNQLIIQELAKDKTVGAEILEGDQRKFLK